jgi:phosphoglycerate dehydrogenase-like enzyme
MRALSRVLIRPTAPEILLRLRAAVPEIELVVAADHDTAVRLAPEVDGSFGWITPEVCTAGSRLRWIQAASAGIESYLFPELVESPIVLTNAKGTYASHLAEHNLAFILAFSRNFHILARRQQQEVWESRSNLVPHEIAGETVLVVGMGGTGWDTAWRCHVLGMRVLAITSTPRPFPDFVARSGGKERLHEFLGEADYACLCCALTPETRHLFGAAEFRAMKPTAYVTNVTRGGVIDMEALLEALRTGEIAGAGLDVTEPEPLPAGHPLWKLENVILTPHTSGHSPHSDRRMLELFEENLRRFARGEPLLNVVDKRRGF